MMWWFKELWLAVLRVRPGHWRYLKVGDVLRTGDEYGMPHFRFVVGTSDTELKAGNKVKPCLMCYRPRRRIV